MLKLLRNPIVLVLATFFTIIFYISLAKTQQKNELTSAQIENITAENQELKENNTVLEEKLSSVNPEQIIRDEFLFKKEGEYVVKIPPPPTEAEESKNSENNSNFAQWAKLFF